MNKQIFKMKPEELLSISCPDKRSYNPELEELFAPVIEAVNKLKRNGLDKIYDDYILEYYQTVRSYELGEIQGDFAPPDFPSALKGYEILNFENLDKSTLTLASS